jgi:hypothetical protein
MLQAWHLHRKKAKVSDKYLFFSTTTGTLHQKLEKINVSLRVERYYWSHVCPLQSRYGVVTRGRSKRIPEVSRGKKLFQSKALRKGAGIFSDTFIGSNGLS